MPTKSFDKDFLPIKEFAEFVGMSASTLRYYDRMGIFVPAKRGTGLEHKYRFYSPTQITTVKMIRVLTEVGVELKTIKELTQDRTPEMVIKLLCKHKNEILSNIGFLQEAYSIIDMFTALLDEAICATETEIFVSQMPERRIILGDVNDFGETIDFFREYIRFCNAPHNPKMNLSYPVGGYFKSMDVFLDKPSQPTRFFSLDPKGYEWKEAGLYLIGYTRGYYGQTNDLPAQMEAYAKINGLEFNGPVYNIFLADEVSVADPEQYLLQVSASVKETRGARSRRPRLHK